MGILIILILAIILIPMLQQKDKDIIKIEKIEGDIYRIIVEPDLLKNVDKFHTSVKYKIEQFLGSEHKYHLMNMYIDRKNWYGYICIDLRIY